MSSFCTNFLLPKNLKPSTVRVQKFQKRFLTKKLLCNFNEIEIFSQFHQHFTSRFCANILLLKNYKAQTVSREKVCQTLSYKKLLIICCWNGHLQSIKKLPIKCCWIWHLVENISGSSCRQIVWQRRIAKVQWNHPLMTSQFLNSM